MLAIAEDNTASLYALMEPKAHLFKPSLYVCMLNSPGSCSKAGCAANIPLDVELGRCTMHD